MVLNLVTDKIDMGHLLHLIAFHEAAITVIPMPIFLVSSAVLLRQHVILKDESLSKQRGQLALEGLLHC